MCIRDRFTGAQLRSLIVPLVIEQVLVVAVGMVDTMMVSAVGEAAVSGVSLVDMLNLLISNLFAALATDFLLPSCWCRYLFTCTC